LTTEPAPPAHRHSLLRTALLISLGLTLPGLAFGFYFANLQFFPGRAEIKTTPDKVGLAVSDLTMRGPDGLTTHGWYVAPKQAPAPSMVVIHGYGGRRERMLEVAKFLHDAGYGLALMDLRHHGVSEDRAVSFGIRESGDIAPYVDDLLSRPAHKGRAVGAIGCSLGAVAALRLASEDRRIAAVVADSPFDSLSTQARWRIAKDVPGPFVPYCWFFTLLAGTITTGVSPGEWEVAQWLPRIAPRPIMLIHGDADSRIPADNTRRLIAAATGPVEGWLVPGADHLDAMDRPEYGRRITAFLARSVK
jgi:pimeloyl-ACP methyl ester carboxylesterase